MAKVIKIETKPKSQSIGFVQPIWKFVLLGLILGFAYWGLTILVQRYAIDQLFCQSGDSYKLTCIQSFVVSGNIATVLVAIIGIALMIKLRMPRPLIVAMAVSATLWGLAFITSGLGWGEIILWDVLLYGLAYALFSWIARCRQTIIVLILTTLVILITRVILIS